MSVRELACNEFVELVTAYLEGALADVDRQRFDAHLGECGGCSNYLEQIRLTMELTGRVAVDDLDDETKAALLAAFRVWKTSDR